MTRPALKNCSDLLTNLGELVIFHGRGSSPLGGIYLGKPIVRGGHICVRGARPIQSERRERLLDAAARLFARWGFAKTSVDEIAREAGISKGAVYLEFPDKEGLLNAVVHREIARYSEDWLQRFAQDPGEWSFARMFQHSIAAVHANPFVKALLTRDQRVLGRVLQRDTDFVAHTIAMRTELFNRLQDAGAMRADIPAPVLAYLMSAIGYGLTAGSEVIPEQHKVPFEEALGALALLLDRGLTPPQARHRKAARAILISTAEKAQAALRANPAAAGEKRAEFRKPRRTPQRLRAGPAKAGKKRGTLES